MRRCNSMKKRRVCRCRSLLHCLQSHRCQRVPPRQLGANRVSGYMLLICSWHSTKLVGLRQTLLLWSNGSDRMDAIWLSVFKHGPWKTCQLVSEKVSSTFRWLWKNLAIPHRNVCICMRSSLSLRELTERVWLILFLMVCSHTLKLGSVIFWGLPGEFVCFVNCFIAQFCSHLDVVLLNHDLPKCVGDGDLLLISSEMQEIFQSIAAELWGSSAGWAGGGLGGVPCQGGEDAGLYSFAFPVFEWWAPWLVKRDCFGTMALQNY